MFEKDFFKLVNTFKIINRDQKCINEMKVDINKNLSSCNVFIPADKTANMNELKSKEQRKLLRENFYENLQ